MTKPVTRRALDQLVESLDLARSSDRGNLLRMLGSIRRRVSRKQPADQLLEKFHRAFEKSQAEVIRRRENLPTPTYPESLPVSERREDILAALASNQVLIIAGETGSGKTTQLPKLCMELGRGARGTIGHTQPRRLAARTVANRIAQELNSSLGEVVGYQVRFTEKVSEQTAVKLMTDGILLAEIQRDRFLSKYDTLIIDEAHERSLNIDFLLGYLKQLLPRRPDLKLIITSATIDVGRFSEHFNKAPVIEVSGRTFPVETRYRPVGEKQDAGEDDGGLAENIQRCIEELSRESRTDGGDVLVFLPGERDIREIARHLRHLELANCEILPLYARLSHAEQSKVFEERRGRGRRIVLATNVAETSLTVPGIRYVIDPGYARISRYSYRTKVQRLPIEAISQASANQRQGRCGRVRAGVCYRLYAEEDFLSRPDYTDPEIQRTNLAAVILRMLDLGLGDIHDFPFIDPPDSRLVSDGYRLLEELGALSADGELNKTGRALARIPVDPRLARMILAAARSGSLRETLVIASALSIQDPRERPVDRQQAADEKHARFKQDHSDFLSYVALWDYYEEQRQALSQNQLRKLCKREYLSFMRMREWRDIHHQLTVSCRELGFKNTPGDVSYETLHRTLLSGLVGHVAQWQENRDYLGVRNRKLQIFPGSHQAKRRPRWIMAAEVVETSKVFARCVARIEPDWILDINEALLKRHYHEPHFQVKTGRVMAYERVSLLGLVIADNRRVHYGPIEPCIAREIFIRSGLVEGRCRSKLPFLRHNADALGQIEDMEARIRRRDLAAGEQVLFDFYNERLPTEVNTTRALESWCKKHPRQQETLKIDRGQLLLREPGVDTAVQFPDVLEWEDMVFPLHYHFEPGHTRDGVTVTVPVGLLNRLPRHRFDWMVPGLLKEKCIELLRGLPKSVRKNLVPIPDYVERALENAQPSNASLTEFLGSKIRQLAGVKLDKALWEEVSLDDYYRLNFSVVDADGNVLEEGRDLDALCRLCASELQDVVTSGGGRTIARTGLIRWDFDELPSDYHFEQAGVEIRAHPALVDRTDSVDLTLLDYPEQALLASRRGLVRLARLQSAQQVRYIRKSALSGNAFTLLLAGAGIDRGLLLEDLVAAIFTRGMIDAQEMVRTREEFEARLTTLRRDLQDHINEYDIIINNILQSLTQIQQRLARLEGKSYAASVADSRKHLSRLIYGGFLHMTPIHWLRNYPRYLKAVDTRLERLSGQLQRDQQNSDRLNPLYDRLYEADYDMPECLLLGDERERYRWMLEEFRVSLYAQSLGTMMAVSEKRLAEQWNRVVEARFERRSMSQNK